MKTFEIIYCNKDSKANGQKFTVFERPDEPLFYFIYKNYDTGDGRLKRTYCKRIEEIPKVAVLGSRNISELPEEFKVELDSLVEKGVTLIIGHTSGAESLSRNYLKDKNVTVIDPEYSELVPKRLAKIISMSDEAVILDRGTEGSFLAIDLCETLGILHRRFYVE